MIDYTKLAKALRFLSVDAVEQANSGHPGMPLGMADVMTVLYKNHLCFSSQSPEWPNRDRFVLSAGHGSMLLYSALYLCGYNDANLKAIKNFRKLNSPMAGHPEFGLLKGIETTTGPLGQGLATAVGMALAESILSARFGGETINYYTYVMASDGDMMEGISHEAGSLAGHMGLKKLIVLYDDNGISIDGPTSLSFSDNTNQRFESYGWHTQTIDGHDYQAIDKAIALAKQQNQPCLISCKTTIGFGAPTKANTSGCHGSPLGTEEIATMRKNLNWPYPPFEIPEDILNAWQHIGSKQEDTVQKWYKNVSGEILEKLTKPNIEFGNAFIDLKRKFAADKPNKATRSLSESVLNALPENIPLVGGSADLTPSNNTKTTHSKMISKNNFQGNYLHYGIREHAMAAAMNGLCLSNAIIPYGGTFCVFLDYLKPALRLSSLMHQGVIYVLTHDSIGLGEDGPTHQPIEHLAHLRSIPNLLTLRPCDGIEVAECWQIALEERRKPTALILSRQNLPTLNIFRQENLSYKGGYLVKTSIKPDCTIISTGSELSLAVDTAKNLGDIGYQVNVASVPCLELFLNQSKDYQESVLGKDPRFIIEASTEGLWGKFLRNNDQFFGINSFGASAPASDLFQHFGLTPDTISQQIHKVLANES